MEDISLGIDRILANIANTKFERDKEMFEYKQYILRVNFL